MEIETMEIEKVSGTNRKKPGGKKQAKRSHKPAPNREPDQLPSPPPEQLLSETPDRLENAAADQPHSQPLEPVQSERPEPVQSENPVPLHSQPPAPLQSESLEPVQTQNPVQTNSQQPEPPQDSPKQAEAAIAPATAPPIDFHTIATAYGDYTKKSFAETKAYVEKLAGVRSLDKIVEIQTEFARQAYETFVTESKRIRELYSGLAKQNLKPFEGFVSRKKPPAH
jgi:hypothetical protein